MFTRKKENALIKASESLKRLDNVLDKSWLIHQPGSRWRLLSPIRVKTDDGICAISKKPIRVGDYCYPCSTDPVRIYPGGRSRALVNAVTPEILHEKLPDEYKAFPLPHPGNFIDKDAKMKLKRQEQKLLEASGTKLLKAAYNVIK